MRATPVLIAIILAGCAGPAETVDDVPSPDIPYVEDDPRLPEGLDRGTHIAGNATHVDLEHLGNVTFPVFQGEPTVIAESTGRELSFAVDPSDPAHMIACSPTGTSVVGIGHSDVWITWDNGTTWETVDPEPGTDTRSVTREGGDCDVAIGPDGTMYLADTWLGDLSFASSTDGETWTGRSVTVTAPVVDRPWLAVDAQGTVHLTYQDVQALMPSVIWYTQTSDGETFLPSVPVTTATDEGAFTWTGNLVVTDDGQTLHSIYTRRAVPVTTELESSGPEQVWVATSTDGGLTWASTLVSQRDGPSSFLYPAIAMDGEGVLYATWSEYRGDDQPTFWARSSDGGASWGVGFPFLEGGRTGAPWITAGPSGAAIQFLGTPDIDRPTDEQRWWFYWATLHDPGTGHVTPQSATTTVEPLYVGEMVNFPEFNMVRADADGRIHIGGVALHDDGDRIVWRPYYQGQLAGPRLA